MNHLTNQCGRQRYPRCFCTCLAHYRSHWNGLYVRKASEPSWLEEVCVFFRCVDQH